MSQLEIMTHVLEENLDVCRLPPVTSRKPDFWHVCGFGAQPTKPDTWHIVLARAWLFGLFRIVRFHESFGRSN